MLIFPILNSIKLRFWKIVPWTLTFSLYVDHILVICKISDKCMYIINKVDNVRKLKQQTSFSYCIARNTVFIFNASELSIFVT